MCAGVVEWNLCDRSRALLCSPPPHCQLPRNAEALLASRTRQLLKILLALSCFLVYQGKKAARGAAGPCSPWLYLEDHRSCEVHNREAVARQERAWCLLKWKPQGLMQKLSAETAWFVFHRELDGTTTFPPGCENLPKVKMCNLGQTPQVFLGSCDGCVEAWWMKEMHWRCCAWSIVHKPWLISSAANELAKYLFGWDFHGNTRAVLYWETHLSLGVLENWHSVWYINVPVLHVMRKGIVDSTWGWNVI